jgi:cytochrome c
MHIFYKIFLCLGCLWLSPAQANQELATSKNCMGCHTVNKKVVGPSFQAIAAKYRGDPTATAKLAQKIRLGGGGVWGVTKMPSNPQVNEAQAQQLAAWILLQ